MCQEEEFQLQLAKTLQDWLCVETELYLHYAMLMKGANTHLVSITFNNIQSVENKIKLLKSCFKLLFARGSKEYKDWENISGRISKLNEKRNKIVHEPIKIRYYKGNKKITIAPSFFNAMAIAKGQTTHQGSSVVMDAYNSSDVQLLEDHEIDFHKLVILAQDFNSISQDLKAFREKTFNSSQGGVEPSGQ